MQFCNALESVCFVAVVFISKSFGFEVKFKRTNAWIKCDWLNGWNVPSCFIIIKDIIAGAESETSNFHSSTTMALTKKQSTDSHLSSHHHYIAIKALRSIDRSIDRIQPVDHFFFLSFFFFLARLIAWFLLSILSKWQPFQRSATTIPRKN